MAITSFVATMKHPQRSGSGWWGCGGQASDASMGLSFIVAGHQKTMRIVQAPVAFTGITNTNGAFNIVGQGTNNFQVGQSKYRLGFNWAPLKTHLSNFFSEIVLSPQSSQVKEGTGMRAELVSSQNQSPTQRGAQLTVGLFLGHIHVFKHGGRQFDEQRHPAVERATATTTDRSQAGGKWATGGDSTAHTAETKK